jgi:hypothetical protein
MSLKKVSPFYSGVCVSLFVAVWLGSVFPDLIKHEILDYISIGGLLAVLFVSAGASFFYKKEISDKIYYSILVSNALLCGVSFFEIHLILLLVLAAFQGLLFAIIIRAILNSSSGQLKNISSLALGIGLSSGITFIPFETVSYFILLSLFMLFILFFFHPVIVIDSKNEVELSQKSAKQKMILLTISGILIFLEISFLIWSLILQDKSQGIIHQLTLIFTCFIIFISRRYLSPLKNKLSKVGWLFSGSLLLTVSFGLLYTFNITVFFIVLFGISISYFFSIVHAVSGFKFDAVQIGVLLIIVAVITFIIALFVQNHIEFAAAINIPENVLALSARQALMKEMASVSSVLIILTGILFLFRRKWNY